MNNGLFRGFLGLAPWIAVLSTAAACELNALEDPSETQSQALEGADLTPLQALGKRVFFDKQLSAHNNESCATCHGPNVGYTGPLAGINRAGAVYPGSIHQRHGNRKPPSAAYATTSPVLSADGCAFVGGNFWDGRATGQVLGNPAADQAMGPFLNPVEQDNASAAVVCEKVEKSSYAGLFEEVWGAGSLDCGMEHVDGTYGLIALSIAAYEDSKEVNAFSSKFDEYKAGRAELTAKELAGLELFEGKARCANCHTGDALTDHTYDNLGVPRNPDNPFYDMDEVYVDGSPINPLGDAWVDPGLGGFLSSLPAGDPWRACAAQNLGKHKVPTLRNVGLRPGPGLVKAYTHNGVFKSLEEVVHFYNTRDVPGAGWPPAEVATNVNVSELGDLGLTPAEESAVVAFLLTLSDGYRSR